MTTSNYLSADEVADELGLHVRTVRAYIRDGRLRAARVGKQYRITRADLAAFAAGAGNTNPAPVAAPLPEADVTEHSTVVVDLDNLKPGDWDRITTVLTAAVGGRDRGQPLRLTTAPEPRRPLTESHCTRPHQRHRRRLDPAARPHRRRQLLMTTFQPTANGTELMVYSDTGEPVAALDAIGATWGHKVAAVAYPSPACQKAFWTSVRASQVSSSRRWRSTTW